MNKRSIEKIGVFTSGGDSPGMNAAIRAVVKTALLNNIEVIGIYDGYEGMMNEKFEKLHYHSVHHIMRQGGTILRCARSKRFTTKEGRQAAYENLMREGIDALVAIGGDGTSRGALVFGQEYDFPIVVLPGTIDNDLEGTDLTIGFDTAINTVVEVVDKIRDTATSHRRLFFVEVMGRDSGMIALHSGIATGADAILIPEAKTPIEKTVAGIEESMKKYGRSGIVIVAEGDEDGGAVNVAKRVKEKYDYLDIRVSVLGHMQRGGNPSCTDRVLASALGYEAVIALLKGKHGVMLGKHNNKMSFTPLEKAVKNPEKVNKFMLEMSNVMSLVF